MASSESFPLIRVTVLGSGGCGKTSIINAFVNNSTQLCNPPPPTDLPRLYYRVLNVREEAGQPARPFCFEVEDTFDCTRTDEGRDIRRLMDMKRKILTLPRGVSDFTPFSLWKPPRIPLQVQDKYHPLALGRMGFLLVFDATSPESFNRVMELHDQVKEFAEYRNSAQPVLAPVIFLVATKMDLEPQSEAVQRLVSRAELYAQQVFVRLWKVSAQESRKVKKMFSDMAQLIFANPMLWEIDYEEEEVSENEEEENCKIM